MRIIKISLILVFNFLLMSCSSLNSSYDCPNRAGVMCKSIDDINHMVDNGQIGRRSESNITNISNKAEFQPYNMTSGFYPGAPLRYGETVQRIWLAPFEDSDNTYHQDSYMYAIIKNGHWIGSPINSRMDLQS